MCLFLREDDLKSPRILRFIVFLASHYTNCFISCDIYSFFPLSLSFLSWLFFVVPPSKKYQSSYKMAANKLISEIEELSREVETAKIKLGAESKVSRYKAPSTCLA